MNSRVTLSAFFLASVIVALTTAASAKSYKYLYDKGAKSYEQADYASALKYLFAYSEVAADELKQNPGLKNALGAALRFSADQVNYAFAIQRKVDELGDIQSVKVVEGSTEGKVDAPGKTVIRERPFPRPSPPTGKKVNLPKTAPDVDHPSRVSPPQGGKAGVTGIVNKSTKDLQLARPDAGSVTKENADLRKQLGNAQAVVAKLNATMRERRGGRGRFDVVLSGVGSKRIQVVKVVRAITGRGLKESKDLVEAVPSTIIRGVSREEATDAKKQLEKAGAVAEVRPSSSRENTVANLDELLEELSQQVAAVNEENARMRDELERLRRAAE